MPSTLRRRAHDKDVLETKLNDMLCACQITLKDAQQAIAQDWGAAYKNCVGNP